MWLHLDSYNVARHIESPKLKLSANFPGESLSQFVNGVNRQLLDPDFDQQRP